VETEEGEDEDEDEEAIHNIHIYIYYNLSCKVIKAALYGQEPLFISTKHSTHST